MLQNAIHNKFLLVLSRDMQWICDNWVIVKWPNSSDMNVTGLIINKVFYLHFVSPLPEDLKWAIVERVKLGLVRRLWIFHKDIGTCRK